MKKAYFCFLLVFTLSVCPLVVSSADLGEGIDPQPPLEELPADEKSDESNDQADALSNNVSSEETQSETETEADSDTSLSETPEPEVEKTQKEKYLEFTKNSLDAFDLSDTFILRGYSLENYFSINHLREFHDTGNLDDSIKEKIYNILAKLYDVVNLNSTEIAEEECWHYFTQIGKEEDEILKNELNTHVELVLYKYYCEIDIQSGIGSDNYFSFLLYDNYITTPWEIGRAHV